MPLRRGATLTAAPVRCHVAGTRAGLAACCGIVLAAALGACTAARVAPPPTHSVDPTAYRAFIVPAPLLPFRLQGAVQLTFRGERETGELSVQALPGPAFRLELRARLTGGLALEVRVDPAQVRVVDYVNETWLLEPNTPRVRLRLFEVDLSPQELHTLLTGRVDEGRFAAGVGIVQAGGQEAVFVDGSASHRFRLDARGLPTDWVKAEDGREVFRVEYREYQDADQPDGTALRLPRKVRLYRGLGPPVLSVGVQTYRPGVGAEPFGPVLQRPPGAEAFREVTLGDPR